MPALSFFADEADTRLLLDRLNADPEVAFIVPDGPTAPAERLAARLTAAGGGQSATFYNLHQLPDPGPRQRWKAVACVDRLADGRHALWHVPSGPLPLLRDRAPDAVVTDPWAGWAEEVTGADPLVPYFGPGHHAVVRLELYARHRPYTPEERASALPLSGYWLGDGDFLAASDFQWSRGFRGSRRSPAGLWWRRLRAWVPRVAANVGDARQPFWAFPSALGRLKAGTGYDARGWALEAGIRAAVAPYG